MSGEAEPDYDDTEPWPVCFMPGPPSREETADE